MRSALCSTLQRAFWIPTGSEKGEEARGETEAAGTIVLKVVQPDAGDHGIDGARPSWVFEAAAETAPSTATYDIQRATPAATEEAVERGDLQHLVETGSEAVPPSVIVEPKTRQPLNKP